MFFRSLKRYLIAETKSGASSVRLSSGVSRPILMLNFKRPTRLKSYLRGSKNMPRKRFVAGFSGGGLPGRNFPEISIGASFEEADETFFQSRESNKPVF